MPKSDSSRIASSSATSLAHDADRGAGRAAGKGYILLALLLVLPLLAALTYHFRADIKESFFALFDLASCKQRSYPSSEPIQERLVAHAGGAIYGHSYTNSREALDMHYASGYRVFELDFDWTSDGQLVLVHDWASTSKSVGVATHVFSYNEFVRSHRSDGLHQLTFDDLCNWLRLHRGALVVTDTKADNRLLLAYLGAHRQDILPQLILQVYRIGELPLARQLKPRAVWLTVYKSGYPDWALSRMTGFDAIVFPIAQYDRYYDAALMRKVHFYAHSIPADSVPAYSARLNGVYGFYVD